MDDIARSGKDHDWLSYRNVDLIRSQYGLIGLGVGIPNLPPPLVACHLDGDRVLRFQSRYFLARDYAEDQHSEGREECDTDGSAHQNCRATITLLVFHNGGRLNRM